MCKYFVTLWAMKQTEIVIIAAVCRNGAIGRGGDLLYHLSADLRRFKELTMGHPIIMGRKTFESFPKGALPGRRNIVITRTPDYEAPGAEVVGSPEEALRAVAGTERAYIIGGGEIYRQFISKATRLELTEINAAPEDADAFFPPLPSDATVIAKSLPQGEATQFRFVTYECNKKNK